MATRMVPVGITIRYYCPPMEFADSGWPKPDRLCSFWRPVCIIPPGVYLLAKENPGFSFAPGIYLPLGVPQGRR